MNETINIVRLRQPGEFDDTLRGVLRSGGDERGEGANPGQWALDFWLHSERFGVDAKGLMLRKTREDLKDFIDLASRMYGPAARHTEKGNVFRFENGAKLFCAYLENERDAQAYQGWSLTEFMLMK